MYAPLAAPPPQLTAVARRLTPVRTRPQATKVVVGTVAAVNKAASKEQGFGGGLQ